MIWFGLIWFDMVWCSLVWFGLVRIDLYWFGLFWIDLYWFGLVGFVLIDLIKSIWFGLIKAAEGVSGSDLEKRKEVDRQKKNMLKSLNMFVSDTRYAKC